MHFPFQNTPFKQKSHIFSSRIPDLNLKSCIFSTKMAA
ncbi:hypothetical protein CP082626L3_1566 [Chlamydia psittaci 08-2626_L3]|nr:hypothetical protein CP082626L3_1566 [Chlamydia psittaci 08-2626_L3]